MDPMAVEQKLIEMSVNLNNLNVVVASLNDAVGAMVRHLQQGGMVAPYGQQILLPPTSQVTAMAEALGSLARHWERAQMAQQQAAGLGGVLPAGPGQGGGL